MNLCALQAFLCAAFSVALMLRYHDVTLIVEPRAAITHLTSCLCTISFCCVHTRIPLYLRDRQKRLFLGFEILSLDPGAGLDKHEPRLTSVKNRTKSTSSGIKHPRLTTFHLSSYCRTAVATVNLTDKLPFHSDACLSSGGR